MGQRRSGNQQHFQAAGPAPRDSAPTVHAKSIGLSGKHRAEHPEHREHGPSKRQRHIEKAHAAYAFGPATYWASVVVFLLFLLAGLYWVVQFASGAA